MRSYNAGIVLLVVLSFAPAGAKAAPGANREGIAVEAGFKKTFEAETLPGTLGKDRSPSTVFASVKVTAEVGEDQ